VLRGLEKAGLAKILREAPRLALREVEAPDAETLRALLAHRAAVMTAYFRNVIKPALAEEAQHARDAAQRLGRRLRKALANDGRWLEPAQRERLAHWVRERPSMARVVEYRQRLGAIMERSGKRSEDMLHALQAWCQDAEASGIATLEEFARRLRGYALAPARG
jgi:stearoyl-CoA desaturase (delta-9 desaturase)